MDPPTPTWEDIAPRLAGQPHATLMALIQDLWTQVPAARAVLIAHLPDQATRQADLDTYRQCIEAAFFDDSSSSGGGSLHGIASVRTSIQCYAQTSNDSAGALELLFTFLEAGLHLARHYPDIGQDLYDELEAGLNQFSTVLFTTTDPTDYPPIRARIAALESIAWAIEWCYHDLLIDRLGEIQGYLMNDDEEPPA